MVFRHDFKYKIPEMDRLPGAAADMGIHFTYGRESTSDVSGEKHLVQVVNTEIGDTSIMLIVSNKNPDIRGKTE